MVDHVYPITRNPRFSEVLRPSAFGPSLGRTALVLLFFLLPLLGAAGQTWQLRASLVELPGGVLVDPTLPNGVGFRGFTGLTLLTGEVARPSVLTVPVGTAGSTTGSFFPFFFICWCLFYFFQFFFQVCMHLISKTALL